MRKRSRPRSVQGTVQTQSEVEQLPLWPDEYNGEHALD